MTPLAAFVGGALGAISGGLVGGAAWVLPCALTGAASAVGLVSYLVARAQPPEWDEWAPT